jgi:hypothetical protein
MIVNLLNDRYLKKLARIEKVNISGQSFYGEMIVTFCYRGRPKSTLKTIQTLVTDVSMFKLSEIKYAFAIANLSELVGRFVYTYQRLPDDLIVMLRTVEPEGSKLIKLDFVIER